MNRLVWKLIAFLLFAMSLLLAEDTPEIRLPKVAPFAHWKVSYTYDAAKPPVSSGVHLNSVEYLLTGKTALVTHEQSDGTRDAAYWFERYEVHEPAPGEIRLKEIPGATGVGGFFLQFPGLEWLKPANYVNTLTAYGESCLYFRKVETLAQLLEVDPASIPENSAVTREAWISVATGLPVALATPGVVQRFTFLPAPADPVVLPPAYQAYLKSKFAPGPRPGQAASRAR